MDNSRFILGDTDGLDFGVSKAKAKPTKRLAPIPFDTPKNQRAIATYTRVLSHAFHTLSHSIANQLRTLAVGKAYNPDEPRDERGRWEGGGGIVIRDVGARAGNENVDALSRPGHLYRGMTKTEYDNTVGAGRGIKSNEAYSTTGEGTSLAGDAATAESYINFGRDDPRTTGQSNYLIEAKAGAHAVLDRDGYYKAKNGVPHDQITRVWEMRGEDGAVVAHQILGEHVAGKLFGKADKTPEEILAEAMAIVEALDLSTLQVIVEDLTNEGIDVATDAGILAIAQFGMEDNASLIDHVNTRAVDFAKDRAAELIGMRYNAAGKLVPSANAEMRIDDSTRDMVRDSIVAGLENGDRITEIADDLADLYAFSDERAALIANTEVRRAQSQGALEGYKETEKLGVEMFKIWLVADSPCEVCEPNGEQGAIPLDDEFDSGDDAPPAHPSCRCVLAPVVDPDAFEPDINPEEDMGYRA